MQAVILAAGRGTRLKPLTDFRSKAMVPILDKPIVARVLNSIYLNGIRKFIIVVSLVDSTIKNYFYDNLPKDAEIQFVLQEVLNGTAGALEIAAPLIKEDFLVSACDSLYPSHVIGELISLFEKTNSDAVMAVMKASKETINKSSAITLNEKGEIISIIEKPNIEEIDTDTLGLPLYIFKQKSLGLLSKIEFSLRGEKEIPDALKIIISGQGSLPCVYVPYRHDLTSLDDLKRINIEFLKDPDQQLTKSYEYATDLVINDPVLISGRIEVGNNCEFGPNVLIEGGASVGNNVRIENSIILSTAVIPDNEYIFDQVCY